MSGCSEKPLGDFKQKRNMNYFWFSFIFEAANYIIGCIIMTFFTVRKQKTSINSSYTQWEPHKHMFASCCERSFYSWDRSVRIKSVWSNYCFVLNGLWRQMNQLVRYCGDLAKKGWCSGLGSWRDFRRIPAARPQWGENNPWHLGLARFLDGGPILLVWEWL